MVPKKFRVVAVERIDSAPLAAFAFADRKKQLKSSVEEEVFLTSAAISENEDVATALSENDVRPIDGSGEVLLFHGTGPGASDSIMQGSFDMGYSRAQLYGPGTYFAERSTKSDEYAKETEPRCLPPSVATWLEKYGGRLDNVKNMLIARVAPGRMLKLESHEALAAAARRHGRGGAKTWADEEGDFDSVLGDRNKVGGLSFFREVIVGPNQAIPALHVLYQPVW